MVRVLHVRDYDADFQTERGAGYLSRGDLGSDFVATTHTLGPRGDSSNLPSAIINLRRTNPREIDVLHAWGLRALSAAAMGTRARIAFTPTEFPRRRDVRWLRAIQGYRDVHVVCPTATMRRAFVERGVPIDRVHLIRPGVEFARIKRRRDPALRASLGFVEDDVVLLAAGESTRGAAHDISVWSAAILGVLNPRHKLLVWGRGDRALLAAKFGRRLHQPDLVHVAENRLGRRVDFEELLPATDLVLVTARGPVSTLPINICMAAGLPIVATVTYTVGELLEDRHTALMVPKPAPRLVAQRVLDLRKDTGVQWTISDMARTEAYEYFSLSRFVDQHRTLYRQIASGQNVHIPEMAPGAGLRFHGRG